MSTIFLKKLHDNRNLSPMMIADLLRAWRHHEELSVREAAERIGIDRGSLFRLEKGEAVNQKTLVSVWRWMLQ